MTGGRRGWRDRRAGVALAVLVTLGVIVLAVSSMQGTLVYYRTPSEILSTPGAHGARIRLGGEVVPGSLRRAGAETAFLLTDGRRQIAVVERGAPPGAFREGRQAVVEGVLDGAVFESDKVMVKHSNEYRASEGTS